MFKLKLPKLGINFKKFQFGKLSKPGRVLVLESTGSLLYGAVASCTTSSAFALGAVVLSTATDRTAAVGEVLAQLKGQSQKRLPATAVLVSSSAAGALLSLPIDPKKPRPAAQMAEMVRWELEELSVQQNELWTLGALLMGRGDLSHAQRRELEGRARDGNQRLSAAVYQGAVDAGCLEECLLLQEQLLGDDEELATGWFGQAAGEEEEDGFSWLVSGVGSGQCASWVKACKKHNVFLARVYPRLAACLPLFEPAAEWLLADVAPEQWGVWRGQGPRIDAVLSKPCAFGRADVSELIETVGDLLRPECNRLHLCAPGDQWPELAAALEQAHGRRGLRIFPPEGDSPLPQDGERLAVLSGAARHHLGLNGKGLPLAPITAQPPAPPLWKRRELWPWVGIALIVVGLGSYDTYMRLQTARNKAELSRLDIEYERKMQVKRQAEALAAEAKTLQGQLSVKEQELREAEKQRSILDGVIRKRQDLVPGLLQVLGEATGELVMLDLLEESADRAGIYLLGWALTDTEGQKFANTLNEQLTPWKYRVKDVKLTRGKGRLGIDGYQLNIWLAQAGSVVDRKVQAAPAPADKKPATPPARPAKQAKPTKKANARGEQSHG
jgi:hypothetical protein